MLSNYPVDLINYQSAESKLERSSVKADSALTELLSSLKVYLAKWGKVITKVVPFPGALATFALP